MALSQLEQLRKWAVVQSLGSEDRRLQRKQVALAQKLRLLVWGPGRRDGTAPPRGGGWMVRTRCCVLVAAPGSRVMVFLFISLLWGEMSPRRLSVYGLKPKV